MPLSVVLDANAYINLEGPDHPPEILSEIERNAKEAKITLYLTPEIIEDLDRDKDESRREKQVARTSKFPIVPTADQNFVDIKANELAIILFPGAISERRAASRKSDCRHIAYAIEFGAEYFVTNDKQILKKSAVIFQKYNIRPLNPSDLVSKLREITLKEISITAPKLLIRPSISSDKKTIKNLLKPLEVDYPDILTRWLPNQFQKANTIIKVIEVDKEIAGVSISNRKGNGVIKLSTFFVKPRYHKQGLGHHLLQHEINSWAEDDIRKALVTLPLDKRDLINFFTKRGFRIDGISPRRYERCPEVVLGRHIVRRIVDENSWSSFVEEFLSDFYPCERLQNEEPELWVPALSNNKWVLPFNHEPFSIHEKFDENGVLIELVDYQFKTVIEAWDTYNLETELFPMLFSWPGREAAIIPIQEHFVKKLFEYYQFQGELFENYERARLRPDNVYYRSPTTHGHIERGTHILFYITHKVKQIVAVARVFSEEKQETDYIWNRYGQLGVLKKDEVISASENGSVQAIRFDYLESLPKPVDYSDLKNIYPSINLQTAFAIPFEVYIKIRRLGGLT